MRSQLFFVPVLIYSCCIHTLLFLLVVADKAVT